MGLSQDDEGNVELSIGDDGVGFDPEQSLERPGSLGLQLVHLLTRQLHGTLKVQRAAPTRFTLRFPLARKP
ncbi:hypothetical protein FQZ97_1095530 [compost metagenome]